MFETTVNVRVFPCRQPPVLSRRLVRLRTHPDREVRAALASGRCGMRATLRLIVAEALQTGCVAAARFRRSDPGSGLTDGETAKLESVGRGGSGMVFRLDDGKIAKLGGGDAWLRHINRAFYIAISRA